MGCWASLILNIVLMQELYLSQLATACWQMIPIYNELSQTSYYHLLVYGTTGQFCWLGLGLADIGWACSHVFCELVDWLGAALFRKVSAGMNQLYTKWSLMFQLASPDFFLMAEAGVQNRESCNTWGLSPSGFKLLCHHFCFIPLARAGHKASQI